MHFALRDRSLTVGEADELRAMLATPVDLTPILEKGSVMDARDEAVQAALGMLIWMRNACYGQPGMFKDEPLRGFTTLIVPTAETLDEMIERLRAVARVVQ